MVCCWKYKTLWEMAPSEVKSLTFCEFDFETSDLEFDIWKHTTSSDKGGFFTLLSRNLDDHNWAHRFVILYICWDTASGKTGLWQLPIASSTNWQLSCSGYMFACDQHLFKHF